MCYDFIVKLRFMYRFLRFWLWPVGVVNSENESCVKF